MGQFGKGTHISYIAGASSSRPLGLQYVDWLHYEEKHLTPEQKAQGEDAFADAFAALPPTREVWAGWGLLMSELCRRAAREHRGLDVGEWPHAMPKPVMSSTRNNEGQDTGNGCLPLA